MRLRTRRINASRGPVTGDTPAYLAEWSKRLAEALDAADLRLLVGNYRELATNTRRSAEDRTFAKRRMLAIQKEIKLLA